MKIDIYKHVMPQRYREMMKEHPKDLGIVKSGRASTDANAGLPGLVEAYLSVRERASNKTSAEEL